MLPSQFLLALAFASSLVSARPATCDEVDESGTCMVDESGTCMESDLSRRDVAWGERWKDRNLFNGDHYENSDDSRWNPRNWFRGRYDGDANSPTPTQERKKPANPKPANPKPVKPLPKEGNTPTGSEPEFIQVPGIPGFGQDEDSQESSSDPNQPVQQYPGENAGNSNGKKAVLFFASWAIYDRNYKPADVPVDEITHLVYSFAKVNGETGEVTLADDPGHTEQGKPAGANNRDLYGSLREFNILKTQNRNLKLIMAIGGWGTEKDFSGAASTQASRRKFAESSVKLLKDLGFDGLDIDWEYPTESPDDKNAVLLLQETRKALNDYSAELGKDVRRNVNFELSFSAPAAPEKYKKVPVRQMDQYLDFWNLMAYDFTGSFSTYTGHQAGLYKSDTPNASPVWADQAVQYYKKELSSHEKIIFGMPLYGRSFVKTEGLGEEFDGVGEGSYEEGVWDVKDLMPAREERCFDESAQASYSYDNTTDVLISYDMPVVAGIKAKYIKEQGLGGAMWWEASGDYPGKYSLVSTVVKEFGGPRALEQANNNIEYPDSVYENLRQGFQGQRLQGQGQGAGAAQGKGAKQSDIAEAEGNDEQKEEESVTADAGKEEEDEGATLAQDNPEEKDENIKAKADVEAATPENKDEPTEVKVEESQEVPGVIT